MTKIKIFFFLCLMFSNLFTSRGIMAEDTRDLISLVLKDGTVVIETRPDLAPKHVKQIKQLISEKKYDGVVFHRVIKGFMAQTGDIEFGNSSNDSYDINRAGTGGSYLSDIEAEFSEENRQKILDLIPMRSFGSVEDVAEVSKFLASSSAQYITGQVIQVDGGMVM